MIVLAIPDLHVPFHHKDALAFLKAVNKKYKPDEVVCLGDLVDWHSISMHDHSPDGMSPGSELEAIVKKAQPFFKLFPDVKLCNGNHDLLPLRRAFKFGLPKELLKSFKELIGAPKGWKIADEHEVDNVIYEHGSGFSGSSGALKSAELNMQSTVIGHIHSFAGVQYSANSKHLIFGFNVGCLIDRNAYAFAYAKNFKRKPILGCGVIVDGIPTFIPMLIDKKGNWIRKI